MRLDPVEMGDNTIIHNLLDYYMGKNSPERQEFIINNLRIEEELEPLAEAVIEN